MYSAAFSYLDYRNRSRIHGPTEEALTAYLEGALDPSTKAATEAHLIDCDHCRERVALYMRLLNSEVTADEMAAIDAIQIAMRERHYVPVMSKVASVYGMIPQ